MNCREYLTGVLLIAFNLGIAINTAKAQAETSHMAPPNNPVKTISTPQYKDSICFDGEWQNIGNIELNLGNDGIFGVYGLDPQTDQYKSCRFPKASRSDYMDIGGFWIRLFYAYNCRDCSCYCFEIS